MSTAFTGTIRVELRGPSPTGFGTVRIGSRLATINLQVDEDGLIELLGRKAALAKTKKSRLQAGLIVATMVASRDDMVQP